MRLDAVIRFDNTFDVYVQEGSQDPINGEIVTTYVFDRAGIGVVVPGSQGGIYLSTRTPLKPREQVRNVIDRNGVAIFAVGDEQYVMYVNECSPVYDAFGSITGYKSLLKRDFKKTPEERYQTYAEIRATAGGTA